MKKKNLISEVWDVMPKRFQGTIMGFLIFMLVMTSSELLRITECRFWEINLIVTLVYIFGIFKVTCIIYPWWTKEK